MASSLTVADGKLEAKLVRLLICASFINLNFTPSPSVPPLITIFVGMTISLSLKLTVLFSMILLRHANKLIHVSLMLLLLPPPAVPVPLTLHLLTIIKHRILKSLRLLNNYSGSLPIWWLIRLIIPITYLLLLMFLNRAMWVQFSRKRNEVALGRARMAGRIR